MVHLSRRVIIVIRFFGGAGGDFVPVPAFCDLTKDGGSINMTELWLAIQNFVFTAGGGMAIVCFLSKKWIDKQTEKKLKVYQKKLDEEFDKLQKANERVNHIILSLYDEENKAYKEIASSMLDISNVLHRTADLNAIGFFHSVQPNNPTDQFVKVLHWNEEFMKAYSRNAVYITDELFASFELLHNNIRKTILSIIQSQYSQDQKLASASLTEAGDISDKVRDLIKQMRCSLEKRKASSLQS